MVVLPIIFSYDGGGDYRSVIRTHKGDKVTITYDPSAINYSKADNLPVVEIKNNPFLKRGIVNDGCDQ